MNNIAITLAWILAAVFLGISIFGCFANSLYGIEALFSSCKVYNFTHMATAIAFALVGWLGGKTLIPSVQAFGVIYMLISLVGFLNYGPDIGDNLSHDAYINLLTYMVFLIGVILSLVGMILPKHLHLISTELK